MRARQKDKKRMVRRAREAGEIIQGEEVTEGTRLKKAVAEQPAMDAVASTVSPNAFSHFPNKLPRTGSLARKPQTGIRKSYVRVQSCKSR